VTFIVTRLFCRKGNFKVNKRIRKKQTKRAINGLIAACDDLITARERVFQRALQKVDARHEESGEAPYTTFRCYMAVAAMMASSGPPPFAERE